VATSNTAGDVVVDTAGVGEEVLVDGEGTLKRSVVVELVLDGGSSGGVHDGAGGALVLGPGAAISALLGGGAAWSITAARAVGEASISDNTGVLEVLPGEVDVTTVAAVVVVVARDLVLRGEDHVLSGLAESV